MNYFKNAYALLIGVGGYKMEETVNDATAIHSILADKSLAGYKNITLLTEETATRDRILSALDKLINETDEYSSVLIYYSGHGGVEEKTDQYFLVPNDYDSAKQDETWVKAEEINERLNKLKTK